MIASERGGTNIVQIFLEQKGIDINAKNNDEMTAILLAAKNLRKGVVELLSNADGIEYDHQKIDEVSNPPQNNNGMNNLRNNMRINGVKIIPGHCTYEQTGRNFAYHQRYYLCETCKILPPYGVCEECAKVCHKGHFLLEVVNRPGSGGFFCDCGAGECLVQCKLMQNK